MSTFLEALGVEDVCRVATREAGYGFGVAAAQELKEAGCKLVLTGDCGTSDHEALGYLGYDDNHDGGMIGGVTRLRRQSSDGLGFKSQIRKFISAAIAGTMPLVME